MNDNKGNNLVAVKDLNDDLCGKLIWWELDGFIKHDVLIRAWSAAQLPPELQPVLPESATALRLAMHKVSTGNIRARKVKNAWAVVTEDVDGKAYKTEQDWVVELQADDSLKFSWVSPRNMNAQDHELSLSIQNWYDRFRSDFCARSISTWLTNPHNGLVGQLDAVTMRERGGLYFIPKTKMVLWNKIVGLLKAHSKHSIHNIPALFTDDVVESVMSGVMRELDNTVSDVDRTFNEKELGARAIQTQLDRLADARAKAARYKKMLGANLDGLEEIGGDIQASLAEALLLKRAEQDRERNARNGQAA